VATTRILTVADAETIQQLLREPARALSSLAQDRRHCGPTSEPTGCSSAEGEKWRRQRKYVMTTRLNAARAGIHPRLEQVAGRLRRRWWRAALAGMPFDAMPT